MNPAVQAVICGRRRQQVSQTFNANASWTAPFTTSRVDLRGYGARGANGSSSWLKHITTTYFRRDGGPNLVFDNGTSSGTGPMPNDYCDGATNYSFQENPTYFASQVCYHYEDTSIPPTTGAASTAFGKALPGSTGNVAPATTTFSDIPITPGASYNIVVPAGGSVTITYFK